MAGRLLLDQDAAVQRLGTLEARARELAEVLQEVVAVLQQDASANSTEHDLAGISVGLRGDSRLRGAWPSLSDITALAGDIHETRDHVAALQRQRAALNI